jgi:Cu2+-exporting ATPase
MRSSLAETIDPSAATQSLRGEPTRDAASAPTVCAHCGQPVAPGQAEAFCCFGCRTVYHALRGAGLLRFYDLRGERGEPVGELALERRDRGWLDASARALAAQDGDAHTIALRLQGLRCSACVWLIERLFARTAAGLRIVVNPALGLAELTVRPGFDLPAFAADVERFGYLVGPADGATERPRDGLLLRIAICSALAMNAMMFAAAIYLGLPRGPLYDLLQRLNFGAATLAVLIGGPVFFASALQAIRRGVLHLDVPIALGIALSYAAASWAFFAGHERAAYFDSLAVFVALMLLGRYLQERAIERSRRELLADDGIDGLVCRRLSGGRVQTVPIRELRAGDQLLLAPADLVPVAAELLDESANCSLDWINGEAQPRSFRAGQTLPAGAFNIGLRAVRVRLTSDFAGSALIDLLRAPAREQYADLRLDRFAGAYVAAVLALAGAAIAYWAGLRGDVVKALEVATAVCVITCPCAIGIAIPLAYEMVHASLRRSGLFVRSASFLDRARSVRQVVFDKTGTLTTGRLKLAELAALRALDPALQRALYDMASRSLHPKSVAVKRALDDLDLTCGLASDVEELPGMGLQARIDGRLHRLGRPGWAASDAAGEHDLVYAVDGRSVLGLRTVEELRPFAAEELRKLEALGCQLSVLSGDDPRRVRALAQDLGLPAARALGGLAPEDKASWVRAHDRADLLMIGDGINDSPAVQGAHCSGTPAIDRALLPGRTDFYFTTAGLAPVRMALVAAHSLAQVVRANIVFALAYNALVVSVAFAGLMQPWLAALLMPASSIAVLARTSATLSRRSRAWTS